MLELTVTPPTAYLLPSGLAQAPDDVADLGHNSIVLRRAYLAITTELPPPADRDRLLSQRPPTMRP